MSEEKQYSSIEQLQDIRSIMDRSARFLTLSGWSGVWAGVTALVGAWIANRWLSENICLNYTSGNEMTGKFLFLAIAIFVIALIGAFFFTYRKTRQYGQPMWNNASKQLLLHGAIPLLAGAVFVLAFLYNGSAMYIAPACLVFYGLALVNASKYTLSDIKYLGILEILLGCICLFMPCFGLYFWAIGFGILHILYGVMMWNKYDKRIAA